MTGMSEADRRRELGGFLRARREALSPAAAGLHGGGARRRTPGLRREEVAQLGGLSVTWYTWIEQGRRDVSVSAAALDRLAGALRLDRAGRAYLFELAGRRDPEAGAAEDAAVPEAVLAAVAAIACPAYLLDRRWTARAWNAAAARLFTGWLDGAADRNLLRFLFLAPGARGLIVDWEGRARRVAAEFHAACGPHLDDPALRALVGELRRRSGDFARFWDAYGVLGREGGMRSFRHPEQGLLHYEQVTFEPAGRPDLTLTMLIGPGTGPG
ncbi:helix-turn-helix domain-containing protein [Roseicella frigidaeris]|nr:helix-turn-helix transcriptional regulator [Roseicella frigidaeris]